MSRFAYYWWTVTPLLSLVSDGDNIVTNPSWKSVSISEAGSGSQCSRFGWVQRADRTGIAHQSAGKEMQRIQTYALQTNAPRPPARVR
jgi:hypothetical protein